ncbi:CEP128 [Acanthosepion pharaonis]|uniref:CEP128 n=1 Tax=Acanthosepion pharaonis TaxID=158019 RepID=A0A812BM87_ACAPH|nr:CEP128 [Sepia pharaonis]
MADASKLMTSSESDDYYESRYYQNGSLRGGVIDGRLNELAGNLKDTTRNLKTLDHMLDTYKDVGQQQRLAVDKLRKDLDDTCEEIKEEKSRQGNLRSGQNRYSPSHSAVRVEKRLNAIQNELRAERQILQEKHSKEDLDNISTELKQALQQHQNFFSKLSVSPPAPPPPTPIPIPNVAVPQIAQVSNISEESKYKTQFLQSEVQKHKLEAEVETLRRRLDQSEGSKSTLQQVVDDLQNQMKKIDLERIQTKARLQEQKSEDENKEKRQLQILEAERDKEKQRLDTELRELRQHLTRTVDVVSEMENVRRSVHKSEQQRIQLSDHIEVLTKDLENQERQNGKLLSQLHEILAKYETAEQGRKISEAQAEDLTLRLQQNVGQLDATSKELHETKQTLEDSIRKRDILRGKAQEAIKQLKLKVKHFEKELDCTKHSNQQILQRNEDLVKELEASRIQNNGMTTQWDSLKRELADALAIRAAQDEQLRLKDIEINELKSLRMDLEKDMRTSNTLMEKTENELQQSHLRTSTLESEKVQLEEKLSTLNGAHQLAQDHAQQLKYEIQELSQAKADLSAQLTDIINQRQDLRQANVDLELKESQLKQQCEALQTQLKENKETYFSTIETLKCELNETRVREAHEVQDLTEQLKQQETEYKSALHSLKLELAEERSMLKLARNQDEKQRSELDRIHHDVTRLEEENAKLIRKLEKAYEDIDFKDPQMIEEGSRLKDLEEKLYDAYSRMKRLQHNQMICLNNICKEVESVVNILNLQNGTSLNKNKLASSSLIAETLEDPDLLTAEIKNNLRWLQCELKLLCRTQKREPLKDVSVNPEEFNLGSRKDNTSVAHSLAFAPVGNLPKGKQEAMLQNKIGLSEQQQLQGVIQLPQKEASSPLTHKSFTNQESRQHIIDEMEDFRDNERGRIQERYIRLQETMKSLQQELELSSLPTLKVEPTTENHEVNVGENCQCCITFESPPPPNKSLLLSPLSLSDEDFKRKFLSEQTSPC